MSPGQGPTLSLPLSLSRPPSPSILLVFWLNYPKPFFVNPSFYETSTLPTSPPPPATLCARFSLAPLAAYPFHTFPFFFSSILYLFPSSFPFLLLILLSYSFPFCLPPLSDVVA